MLAQFSILLEMVPAKVTKEILLCREGQIKCSKKAFPKCGPCYGKNGDWRVRLPLPADKGGHLGCCFSCLRQFYLILNLF